MKTMGGLIVTIVLAMSCAKAPVKPTDSRGTTQTGSSVGQPAADHTDHADHEKEMGESMTADGVASDPASTRADDIALLKAWTKGQYVGNEQLQLSLLPTVPLQ